MDLIVKGITAARALQACYEATQPICLGVLHARAPLSDEEAEDLVEDRARVVNGGKVSRFDYVHGRPLKLEITFHVGALIIRRVDLFDRDAPGGEGSARRALEGAGAEVTDG